jgi:hypothetical protein
MNTGTQLTKSGELGHLKTLEQVVADFRVRFNYKRGVERSEGHHDPVVDVCIEAPNLTQAIELAVDGRRRDGKMFSEGSCIRASSKKKMTQALLRAKDKLRACRDFEAVYEIVRTSAKWGIGKLTIYNVTARVAAHMGIHPEAFLYVHSGPLRGWKALTGTKANPHRVPVEQLPKALRRLPVHRVEDLLCEYNELLHPGMINGNARRDKAKRGGTTSAHP